MRGKLCFRSRITLRCSLGQDEIVSLSQRVVCRRRRKKPATRRLCGPGRDRARIIRDHIASARLRCYLGHDFTLIIAIFQINLHTLRIAC